MRKTEENMTRSELGYRIVDRLNEMERSQAWLAKKCSFTNAGLNRILCGKSTPTIKNLYTISQIIEVDFYELAMLIIKDCEAS